MSRTRPRFCAAVLPLVDVSDPGGRLAGFALRLAGAPLFTHALRRLDEIGLPTIVAVPAGIDLTGALPPSTTLIEHAGSYRSALTESVRALPATVTSVLVHDVANATTPAEVLCEAVRRAADPHRPVVVARRLVADTVKTITGGFVGSTVPRDELESVHAPLVVPRDALSTILADPQTSPQCLVDLVAAATAQAPHVVKINGSLLGHPVRDQADLVLLDCAHDVLDVG